MKTRRGFFKSLARAAAIVALAPQIAFRARPEEWVVDVANPEIHEYFCIMEPVTPEMVLYSDSWEIEFDVHGEIIENFDEHIHTKGLDSDS